MPDPQVYAAINKYKAALLKAEQASAERLINAYASIFQKLETDIKALEADILALGNNPTRGQVIRLARYNALLKQTAEQMERYAVLLENEVSVLRQKAIADAIAQNRALVQAALPNLPPAAQNVILTNFNRLNPQAVETLLGALTKNSPLTALLNTFGADASAQIADVILQGVALGYNPRKVAARIVDAMGGNLSRALTISRTEMLRAYRTGTLAGYAANGDVVKGWRWSATFDNVTCLACLALDGKEFELSQSYMPAHPNCRCAPTPITVTYKDLGFNVDETTMRQRGAEWFDTLPETKQREFFSASAWRAYQAGAVTLDDFIGVRTSKQWGDSYVERSLKDILGAGAGKYYN